MTYLLNHTMDIYSRAPNGGYTVLEDSGIACRLFGVVHAQSVSAADRAEEVEHLNLHFAPDVTLPATCQVEIDGQRYTVERHSVRDIAPFGPVIQRRADVVAVHTHA